MTTFRTLIRPRVQAELDAASLAEARGHFDTASGHLERAHVLAQASTLEHVRVHWLMLRFAMRQDLTAEAYGQAWRLTGAAVLTAVGLVPTGNSGGSEVNGFLRMPVPDELQQAIDGARVAAPRPRRRGLEMALATSVALVSGALLAGCASAPADLDLSLDRPSSTGVYRVTLVPPQPAPAINQLHSWRVKLAAHAAARHARDH